MPQIIENRVYDEERALYHLTNAQVLGCTFAGPADGESVLKEARDVLVKDCSFSLRYPLWHVRHFRLEDSRMDGATRAPIWYAEDGVLSGCAIDGIKCLRECQRIQVERCTVRSPEFGWKCREIALRGTEIESEYLLFDSRDVEIEGLSMKGKYSFQYMENLHIRNSRLDTKDAFWHSKNVVVENSLVKGEYLGWFSDGLTLINCHIAGTQPLCYCKNLRLIHCTMEDADLAFEYSDVEAEVEGHIDSVKNPRSGLIVADSVGEIVREAPVMECTGQVRLREKVSPQP